ncbi:MAG: helix-turn-helix domain-containing protein [Sphingomonadales bacterium]|nr:helix-turn-helix domain-containing protein [Sphingomonadales bacterium]MDE2170314.1 helix-turn-helix domain-containing protein [Sphingomonadales bacterium]
MRNERRARRRNITRAEAQRAKIVLKAAHGKNNCEIAAALGVTRQTVRTWRSRKSRSAPRIGAPAAWSGRWAFPPPRCIVSGPLRHIAYRSLCRSAHTQGVPRPPAPDPPQAEGTLRHAWPVALHICIFL